MANMVRGNLLYPLLTSAFRVIRPGESAKVVGKVSVVIYAWLAVKKIHRLRNFGSQSSRVLYVSDFSITQVISLVTYNAVARRLLPTRWACLRDHQCSDHRVSCTTRTGAAQVPLVTLLRVHLSGPRIGAREKETTLVSRPIWDLETPSNGRGP